MYIRKNGQLVIQKNKAKTNPIQTQFKPKQTQFKANSNPIKANNQSSLITNHLKGIPNFHAPPGFFKFYPKKCSIFKQTLIMHLILIDNSIDYALYRHKRAHILLGKGEGW
jgi:hypothetical protein